MSTKQLNACINELPSAKFANLFGPTEVTDICSFYRIDRKLSDTECVPIGYVCQNTYLIILNSEDKEVTLGEMGELCVRGHSLPMVIIKILKKQQRFLYRIL